MKFLFFTLLFSINLYCYNQNNYFIYHNKINDAEILYFMENEVDSSLAIYDEVFNTYEFVFLKDLLNAAQIAVYNKRDYEKYLLKSFEFGFKIDDLSKLLFLNFEKLKDIENELKVACKNILPSKFLNQSLCHGSMSNIEVLHAADRYFMTNTHEELVNSYINQVSQQIINGKLPKVSENGMINLTGMFIGITGVGYQLLRFYDWENIPSIICLETEFFKYKTLH